MAQENKDSGRKFKKSLVRKLLALIGICCMGQFLVVAMFNVTRGYTRETAVSDAIFVFGFLAILPWCRRGKRVRICSCFVSSMVLWIVLLGSGHGDHARDGGMYYEQGQYQEALESFKKETQSWYLRLRYNYHEKAALAMIAQTYCQLEEFDNARDTYKLIIDRYDGYHADQAEDGVMHLNNGLKIVARYPEEIAETQEGALELYDIAIAYHRLYCYVKAREVYRHIIDMDVPESFKELARKVLSDIRRPRG